MLNALERDRVAKLAEYLDKAFRWDDTPQGYGFWHDVRGMLIALSVKDSEAAIEIQLENVQAALSELKARLRETKVI